MLYLGCPQSVCQYATQIKSFGLRVVIIGVGDNIDDQYTSCLTQFDNEFIDFLINPDAAYDAISAVTCPIKPISQPLSSSSSGVIYYSVICLLIGT